MTAEKIILKPNETKTITACADKQIPYQKTYAILHETEDATIPNFIDLTPSLVEYEYGKHSDIFVTLSNITNNTVIILPKAILCELQPVTITGKTIQGNEKEIDGKREEIVNNFSMDENEILDPDQKDKLKEFVLKDKDIFSISDTVDNAIE